MRILALLTDGFGGYGGIAQYNRDFTSALASLDLIFCGYLGYLLGVSLASHD